MTAAAILAALAVGIVVGVASGLIGIGGGVLIVPFLYFVYATPAWFGVHIPPDSAVLTAHATSLFVIIPTALRGAYEYTRAGLVHWPIVWPIASGAIVAAAAAASIAPHIPAEGLQVAFAIILAASGIRLLRARPPRQRERLRSALPYTAGTGLATGAFSALLGVGGGIVSIPLMAQLIGVEVRRLAATSIGIITLTAPAAVLVYMLSPVGGMAPPGSLGYAHAAIGLPIAAGALVSVRWGTALNQRLDPAALRRLFGSVFVVIAIYLTYQVVA